MTYGISNIKIVSLYRILNITDSTMLYAVFAKSYNGLSDKVTSEKVCGRSYNVDTTALIEAYVNRQLKELKNIIWKSISR